MKVSNISRLGNRIEGLFVIGKKADGSLVLCGSGEKLIGFQFYYRTRLYEYDPITEELKEDVFSDLNLLHSFFELCQNRVSVIDGIGYFIEPEDSKRIKIVKCDFNNHTFQRLFSFFYMDDIMMGRIQLTLLSDRYLAIKLYNKKTCQFDIYDLVQLKKYNLIFAENDDMRYSYVHWIEFDGRPYIVFVKNGKPSWKMEYFIHHWEWSQEFIKCKDEKIFLFPLDLLVSNGNIHLDETCKIAQIGETHDLEYLGYVNNCIVYSSEDLRRHYFEHELNKAETYNDNLFLYDVGNKTTRSMPYDRSLLMSNTGNIYEYKNDNEQLVIRNMMDNQVYAIPDQNGWNKRIIDDLLVMRFNHGIVIYDLKKGIEVERHYTENQYPHVLQPELRTIAALQQNYLYLANGDLLVLY